MISGKEALEAIMNGQDVEGRLIDIKHNHWHDLNDDNFNISHLYNGRCEFRIKPRTITINGIEVPAPFEPKDGEYYFILNPYCDCGYSEEKFSIAYAVSLGAWRTEDEIKQVVSALRSIFK